MNTSRRKLLFYIAIIFARLKIDGVEKNTVRESESSARLKVTVIA